MNISTSAKRNIDMLTIVAHRLGEICDDIIFVGGYITALLITDKAAPDVRATIDVDCIVDVISTYAYQKLEKRLRDKGFKQSPVNNDPICRWRYNNILLDVVPTDREIIGFSNKWYKEAAKYPTSKLIGDSINIKVIGAPYFLATKMEAFWDRGNNDFLVSHDLEDLISIIDGRSEIVDDVSNSSNDLKEYLSIEFSKLMDNVLFMQALPGHLNYYEELYDRKQSVEKRMRDIISLARK